MSAPSVHTDKGPFGVIALAVATSPEVQALSHRGLRLYLVLLARHNARRDGWAWSMAGLARDTGIHRDHIPATVRRLELDGLVEVQRGVGLKCSHYRLLIPPSLRGEGATVAPTVGATVAPTVGATVAPTPQRERATSAPTEGATVAPTEGATVAPTLQRRDNDGTLRPPYPHTDTCTELGNPPSPPASRGEHEGATLRFELPARMRGAKRPEGFWKLREEAAQAEPLAPAPQRELPPMPTRGDAVRQLARDLGVRPREARKMIEREEIVASRPDVPPPAPFAMTDDMARELMRDFGWSAGELRQRYGWTPQGRV